MEKDERLRCILTGLVPYKNSVCLGVEEVVRVCNAVGIPAEVVRTHLVTAGITPAAADFIRYPGRALFSSSGGGSSNEETEASPQLCARARDAFLSMLSDVAAATSRGADGADDATRTTVAAAAAAAAAAATAAAPGSDVVPDAGVAAVAVAVAPAVDAAAPTAAAVDVPSHTVGRSGGARTCRVWQDEAGVFHAEAPNPRSMSSRAYLRAKFDTREEADAWVAVKQRSWEAASDMEEVDEP